MIFDFYDVLVRVLQFPAIVSGIVAGYPPISYLIGHFFAP